MVWELLSGSTFETLLLILQSQSLSPDIAELQQCMVVATHLSHFLLAKEKTYRNLQTPDLSPTALHSLRCFLLLLLLLFVFCGFFWLFVIWISVIISSPDSEHRESQIRLSSIRDCWEWIWAGTGINFPGRSHVCSSDAVGKGTEWRMDGRKAAKKRDLHQSYWFPSLRHLATLQLRIWLPRNWFSGNFPIRWHHCLEKLLLLWLFHSR